MKNGIGLSPSTGPEYFICSLFIDVLSIFGYSVFMELIELKFCGCNFNLRKNIITRSGKDLIGNYEQKEEAIQPLGKIELKPELDDSLQISESMESFD